MLTSIFDGLYEAVFVIRASDHRIEYINNEAKKLFHVQENQQVQLLQLLADVQVKQQVQLLQVQVDLVL